mmetsp:Transcript_15505/g.32422  ORF Transcript_15505/g.32422 Transcript_15505/m.32422 type:complete len:192 (-) Transcript_15505:79-654(-)|eukprot:CAMPEP_0182537020 /NCGR_PEP_ID=MMETSP1323-20130603/21192_1 /TAXON_ID=236787 /ORGANISM="Florenciella parvula, Strain RCC1693" /LENGTH=191 /DNA_ID=CAMNT_0024747335 /DNA_START=53 /DNA_END=628 /DNA_ORIENTATION=+
MSVRAIRRLVVLPRRQMSSSPGSNLAVGDFSAVRVVPCPTTGKALEAADSFIASAELFRFTGTLSSENIGDRSLMVGREAHILSDPEEQPWVYLDHSFNPTVSLSHAPVLNADAPPPVITAKAAVDLQPGAPLTIDYTLHEWDMHNGGFLCGESGRQVSGFRNLSDGEKEDALPRAADHLKELHLDEQGGR